MSLLEIDESISTQESRENCDRYTGSGIFRKSQFVICNSCYWCASFTDLETHHSMTCPCYIARDCLNLCLYHKMKY